MNKAKLSLLMATAALMGGVGATAIGVKAAANDVAVSEGKFTDRPFHKQLTQEEIDQRQAEREARREAVKTALANGDYEAWVEARGENNPFADKITEDNFAQFVEAHRLMEQARAKMADLGIEKPGFGQRGGHGRGGMLPPGAAETTLQ